jgi:hypothetical protein
MTTPAVTHEELRPLLFSLAYRMVGVVGEAEDLVQEAFLRLHRSGDEVDSPKAFLTTVVTRLAIDHVRSARAGDVAGLVDLLAADAVSYADGGGKVQATPLPIYGAAKVARLWASIPARSEPFTVRFVDVNGQPGAVALAADGRAIGVLTLEVADGRVRSLWAVVNPDKLSRVLAAAADQPAST